MRTVTKPNHQNAFDYCMYMMLASNFQKSHISTPLHEKKLYLYYKEEKESDQIQMEEQCLRYIQKLEQKLPPEVWQQSMDVHLVGRPDGAYTTIKLQSRDYVIYVKTQYSKNNPQINLKLWTRKEVA